ncbi:hypothetical protein SAMN05216232_2205 [Virgibacillus subterraneus]|uniref:Uncharacterized protein n=2 Tax=Virgibacillus TaxID=84406 RepID=A0A1H1E341_9BACI|nr:MULTISPECIES: hypothetical protein [Virgibacillus]SDQ83182.1 hypothetical protein SAMN05216231_2704 [Virgibacillus salinus]SEQ37321.1 hypothetical protein SAMN05216232_2205 [Virgibacillus subterraneus]
MRNTLITIIWITGIYCFCHILFDLNTNQSLILLGKDMQITISLLTKVIELLFLVSLFIYTFKYTEKSPAKNCQ